MKRILNILTITMLMLCTSASLKAATIQKTQGWFESGYVTWTWETGATYTVYYRPEGGTYTQLDKELVRQYTGYGRADMVGLKAGRYQFKVVSSKSGEAESDVFTATAHDRSGFAHVGMTGGIGAYKNDGTLKDGAKVIYVTAATAKTVTTTVKTGSKDTNTTEATGLQSIIDLYQKGYDTTPLDIRIIGTIKDSDMDHFSSSSEGLQVKGKNAYSEMPITIEGIGSDATIWGFGILVRGCKDTEFRNFAIMLCMDDCLSLDTENSNVWIHNMDFFYGNTGGDSDQAKGDGTVDIKGKSMNVTVSYNHFYDAGKCSLGGMKSETTDCWMTYHHNWFDHSDSRHPRIRTAFYHVYNNYFDGNAKYGVGCTSGGSSFVESNYFRNCKSPMLISKQGTDAEGDGTFSGENGGVIKAYNNKIINPRKIQYWSEEAVADGTWDAVKTDTRDGDVTATAYSGGTSYNKEADAAAQQAVPASAIDAVDDVALICRGEYSGREGLGAGRIDNGDFHWTFSYPEQDANYAVIADLKAALKAYQSTLVAYGDGTAALNAGATETVDGGDGKGKTQAIDENTNIPVWGGGSDTSDDDTEQKIFIGGDGDFYWLNADNDTQTQQYIADGNIAWDANSSYATDKQATSSDTSFSDPYTGGIAVKSSTGYTQFYCPDGITTVSAKATRSGSASGEIQASADGTSYTKVGTYSAKKGSFTITQSIPDDMKYVRITNTSSGTLFIHGIKVYTAGEEEPDNREDCNIAASTSALAMNIGDTRQISYTSASTGTVSYTSSNSAVATVDASGNVTAVAEGTATITISQIATTDYKAGKATVSVTVSDPRAASTFAVTSDATVALKEGETSQIATTGAAGTVSYKSSNTAIATVDADGLITAVAAGTAVITISDSGNSNVKPATKTVSVSVTKDMTGTEICYFTASTKSASSTMVTVSGNYSNSKGTVSYNATDYTDCVKMESATEIKITPAAACKVTLIFGGSTSAAGKKISLDGTTITLDSNGQYSFTATAGTTYSLKKGDSINLFLIVFEPVTDGINTISADRNDNADTRYTIDGRQAATQQHRQLYISNGRKYIAR